MNAFKVEIERASIFDLYGIVRMALSHHKGDPKSQEILSSSLKSYLYKLLGPLYVRLTLASFKVAFQGRIVGYVLIKRRAHSLHIWDLVVDPEFRGKGIGESLMKFAEKRAEKRHQYITLAVMEGNVPAMRLYEKLGYENLQFSPVCYQLEVPKEPETGSSLVALEPVSGEAVVRSRSEHFYSVLSAVVGSSKVEIVKLLYPMPSKVRRGAECFAILGAGREVGYASIRRTKNLVSILLLISPSVWSTEAENEAVMKVVQKGCLRSARVEICVLQAYERNLERVLREEGCVAERKTLRLALIKKLE